MPRRTTRPSVRLAVAALTLVFAAAANADEGYRLAQTCAGCHGTDGASPGAEIPSLGGLDARYIARAMRDYRSGARTSYIMKIIANGFDDAGTDAIAQWFAAQPWRPTPAAADPGLAAAGEAVAAAQCASCHGDTGEGGPLGPRLAGQPAPYLITAARAYRTGARTDEAAAAALTAAAEDEIIAAAHFYASRR